MMRCTECNADIGEVLLVADVHPLFGDFLFVVKLLGGRPVVCDVEGNNGSDGSGKEDIGLFVKEKVIAVAQEYVNGEDYGDEDFMCPDCECYIDAPWMLADVPTFLDEMARSLCEFDVSQLPLKKGEIRFIYDGATGAWSWE